jgi:Uma2 family endonuclease
VSTTPTRLMTFEEFQQIPEPKGGHYELHHGELVKVAEPEIAHVNAQWQLRELLQRLAGDTGRVHTETPFRPAPEYECWRADVSFVWIDRWNGINRWLIGAPDLVIEVRSPSNTDAELDEKERVCLANGAREFWLVDTVGRTVRVATVDGRITYSTGQSIPLFFGGSVEVDRIFE